MSKSTHHQKSSPSTNNNNKNLNHVVVINTQQEFKKSISALLSFFADDRGRNLLRSFAALSQNYIDLRTSSLHGVATTVSTSSSSEKDQKDNKSLADLDDDEQEQKTQNFSIVYDPAIQKANMTANKLKSVSERIDSITAASSSLLKELLQLLGKVKELSHAVFVAANNFVHQHDESDNTDNREQTISTSSVVNLRLLKDVLEVLVNKQLQNKIATIHVIFNEVTSAAKIGLQRRKEQEQKEKEEDLLLLPPLQWKLTIDQLRIYQTALSADFNELLSAATGVLTGGAHPLESVVSLVERTGILCSKIVQSQ